MALILPGPAVGRISGRVGGSVFSHNKGGPYIRNATKPTTVTSDAALTQKAIVGNLSQTWQTLTAAQRLAWSDWAAENPITNRLGMSIHRTGHQAYIGLNARLLRSELSASATPPVGEVPPGILGLSLAYDIGVGGVSLEFTPTPLDAGYSLYWFACVLDSPTQRYVENQLRYIDTEADETASDLDISTAMTARFGTIQVDNVVVVRAGVLDRASGRLSPLLQTSATVVETS